MTNQPTKTIKLTKSLLDSISPRDIVYAEVSEPGAMGNAGGIIIYVLQNEKLLCYETSIFSNEAVYNEANALLVRHRETAKNESLGGQEEYLKSYYSGMGNRVSVNKDIELKINEDHFTFLKNGLAYEIQSSVKGVFLNVASRLKVSAL